MWLAQPVFMKPRCGVFIPHDLSNLPRAKTSYSKQPVDQTQYFFDFKSQIFQKLKVWQVAMDLENSMKN